MANSPLSAKSDTLDTSAEHSYTPALSEDAVAQLETDARESLGEIEALDTPGEQVGGYIALYNRLIEIANNLAKVAHVAQAGAHRVMAENEWHTVTDAAGTAVLYEDKALIMRRPVGERRFVTNDPPHERSAL